MSGSMQSTAPRRNRRNLFHTLDLALLRYSTDRHQRYLPLGIRQLIKEFMYYRIDNENIRYAVKVYTDSIKDIINNSAAGPTLSELSPCDVLFGPISQWDVSKVVDMSALFIGACKSFNADVSDWDVSNVTDMSQMFENCESFNQPLNDWDVSNVTDMSNMFQEAKSFNQPLDQWNVSRVTDISNMFNMASAFNQNINSCCWISTTRIAVKMNLFRQCFSANSRFQYLLRVYHKHLT